MILTLWCIGVRSCYDEGKRVAETLAMDYHRGAGIEVGWFLHFHIIYEYAVMFCGWGGDIYKRVSINLIIVR
jgi:hypothetical protein